MRVASLEYRPDSSVLFDALRDEPWPVFLDSGRPWDTRGRWDILSARPWATLSLREGIARRVGPDGVETLVVTDPWRMLRGFLPRRPRENDDLPFVGGAIGYLGYDLGRSTFSMPPPPGEGMPDLAIGLYDWAVLVDHQRAEAWMVSAELDPNTGRYWADRLRRLSAPAPARRRPPFRVTGPTRANFAPRDYAEAFARVLSYIREGDCYQVNLAQRFTTPCAGDAWEAYRHLRRLNPAPFAAYLDLAGVEVLCSSPERFIRLHGDALLTQPIKGTRQRAEDPQTDALRASELSGSEKDRAENLMIVDLLRNDLGKVCVTGSIKVERLFEVQSFASVHHLVSSIRGRLRPGLDAFDVLAAAFPGGSITGAPKRRAMQIIDELEPDRRGVYCGSLLYIGYDGRMDSNIAIRTLARVGDAIYHWAGGGLVADSRRDGEYQECLDKAAPLVRVLDSFRTQGQIGRPI